MTPKRIYTNALDALLPPVAVTRGMKLDIEYARKNLSDKLKRPASDGEVIRAAIDYFYEHGAKTDLMLYPPSVYGSYKERLTGAWVLERQKAVIESLSEELGLSRSEVMRRVMAFYLSKGGDTNS